MSKNIVLLTVDALRADHLSCYGYNRETSPVLNSFAEEAIVYENAYSASSHTREAIPALLTGRDPPDAVSEGFSRGAETIPMYLDGEHVSGAFHSNPYVSRAYGYDTSFDHFDDDLRIGQNKLFALVQRAFDKFVFNRGQYHARAEEINDRSLSWLDSLNNDQPFFLWNHYMDVHGPYNPPEGYARWSDTVSNNKAQKLYDRLSGDAIPSQEEVELAVDLYDGEIRYTDACIGRFIESLESRDLLADSLLIITSDHGDLFGEYGQYAHPRYVYPELTRVPLLVADPSTSPQTVETPASTLDILPTILDAVGLDDATSDGSSLLTPRELPVDRRVYSSATGEGESEGTRRLAVQTKDRGYRFLRQYPTGEISEEVALRLPSGEPIDIEAVDAADQEALMDLREGLVIYSAQWGDTATGVDDDGRTTAEIEDRLDALGYK